MIHGYIRVSSKVQIANNSFHQQEAEIIARYPNATIYREQFTGSTTDRPILTTLIERLQEGDTLVVTKLDRLARNTIEGIELIEKLFELGVAVHVLNYTLLENTSVGKFFLTTMLAFAEFERNLILERTEEGKAIARSKPGYREGRPRKRIRNFDVVVEEYMKGELTSEEAADKLNISKSTWYSRLKEWKQAMIDEKEEEYNESVAFARKKD